MRIGKNIPIFARGNVYSSKRVTMPRSCCPQKGAGNLPDKICKVGTTRRILPVHLKAFLSDPKVFLK